MKLYWQLGCIGIKTENLQADVFIKPNFGAFVNDGVFRRWYGLWPLWKPRLLKVEVLDPLRAMRVFRRTMTPYTLLTRYGRDTQVLSMSFPFMDEVGEICVFARTDPEDPASAKNVRCRNLRPIDFRRRP